MLGYAQALLGEYLHKIKSTKEMLQVANLWAETVPNNELPENLNDPCTRSEELAEELCLNGHQPAQQDARFWISWAMSKKAGILSSALNKAVNLLSSSMGYTIVTLML
jgi:hypothetical protein